MSHSFLTPWTVAHHAPLSVGFPRQITGSRLLFPSPGDLHDPGIEPMISCTGWQILYHWTTRKALEIIKKWNFPLVPVFLPGPAEFDFQRTGRSPRWLRGLGGAVATFHHSAKYSPMRMHITQGLWGEVSRGTVYKGEGKARRKIPGG